MHVLSKNWFSIRKYKKETVEVNLSKLQFIIVAFLHYDSSRIADLQFRNIIQTNYTERLLQICYIICDDK